MNAFPAICQSTHMPTRHITPTPTPTPPLTVRASVSHDTPLTHVSLAFIAQRLNLSLRFGHPLRELPSLSGWRCALFLPGALFCRTHWACLDAIEAQGIDPVVVSPAYWRTLGEHLAAQQPLPAYTATWQAAYCADEVR